MADDKKGNAATRAKNKWQATNCDRINLVIPKGQKALIKAAADAQKESLNGYIIQAVGERMERDNNLPQDEALTARVFKAGPDGMIDTEERV